MLIIGRYPGVPNFLIHERFSYFDRLTAILTFLPLFHYQIRAVFGCSENLRLLNIYNQVLPVFFLSVVPSYLN